jgi:hypothetical protein
MLNNQEREKAPNRFSVPFGEHEEFIDEMAT